ncbi:3-isopropylmalate dehydratase small subunit [Bacillus sp. FJAT-44742]|uniref:3-isopropylmalate dehydratase small subunit n=1 Tax=Bacillus sp. FJAT-44742 TaxID=2014005 RepID=UPI000C24F1D2|nr:3-isopropylmalate dehydratase small subunit [Bacillus sp. FJAT-44742]
MRFEGDTHTYGKNIDTDRIIPGKYTKTLDLSHLAQHVFEDLDPQFKNNVKQGDIVVADTNFGCGSSREQAPLAIKSSGVSLVIARSFARIFFRNAINVGMPVMEVPDHRIEQGDKIIVNLYKGEVHNVSKNETYYGTSMPEVMINILKEGGLTPYLRKHGTYQITS